MPTKHSRTAAICSRTSLIVAGGTQNEDTFSKLGGADSGRLNTVEILDTETSQWSTAASLPIPIARASFTVYNYMLGGMDKNGLTRAVFTTTVTKILMWVMDLFPQ